MHRRRRYRTRLEANVDLSKFVPPPKKKRKQRKMGPRKDTRKLPDKIINIIKELLAGAKLNDEFLPPPTTSILGNRNYKLIILDPELAQLPIKYKSIRNVHLDSYKEEGYHKTYKHYKIYKCYKVKVYKTS